MCGFLPTLPSHLDLFRCITTSVNVLQFHHELSLQHVIIAFLYCISLNTNQSSQLTACIYSAAGDVHFFLVKSQLTANGHRARMDEAFVKTELEIGQG